MERIGEVFRVLTKRIVIVLLALFSVFLAGTSIFGNCFVNHAEYTFFVSDIAFVHMVALILLVIVLLMYRKFIKGKMSQNLKSILWIVAIISYIVSMAVISIYVSMQPRADQKFVVDAALAMLDGDYSAFETGGYINVYPNQVGIVYIFYWLFKIFPFGYKTVGVLNAISLGVIVWGMNGIGRLFLKKNNAYSVGIITMLFFPLSCYVTFIYGNLIGMALSTVSIYFSWRYFEDRKKSQIFIAIVTSALAVLVKENFLIPMIGICIFILLDIVIKRNKKSILWLFAILAVTFGVSNIVEMHMENITDQKIESGVPTLAWVAMGMQGGYMAPGWHNQYNEDVYRANNCDTELTNEVVKKDIANRVKEFVNNPGKCVKFFFKKTISQWNNPTFEGYWINDLSLRTSEGHKIKKISGVLASIAGEPGNKMLTWYSNIFQSMIWIGICLWIVLGRREVHTNQLLLATIFVGGFIFHLIWEAKCQYVLPYFVLLFPYACKGFSLFLDQIELFLKEKGKICHRCKKIKIVPVVLIVSLFMMFVSFVGQKYVNKVFGLDNERYENFLKSGQ